MIPVRLQIKGFLSYHDPVDLDFEGFDMACISGSNGAGKSSLLDAITWALFGEARRRDDTVINHRTQKEGKPAEVILDFDYENARYRVQRTKTKDKTAALDFYLQAENDSWKPLTEATLRATQERISQTLRLDYETFINASFFLQGRADQFAQQKPSDRKRILASILGLEVWEEYKEEALHRRREQEKSLAICDSRLTEIQAELSEGDARKAKLASLNQEYESQNKLAQANRELLDQHRKIADRLESDKSLLEKNASEIKRLQSELDQKLEDLRLRQEEQKQLRLQLADEKAIRAGVESWIANRQKLSELDALAANFRQFEAKRQSPLLVLEAERAKITTELENLTTRLAEISILEQKLPVITREAYELTQKVAEAESALQLKTTLENDLLELQNEQTRATAENSVLKVEMDEMKERLDTLAESSGSTCPTCEKPLEPQEKQHILDDLNTRGKQKGETYRRNLKTLESSKIAIAEKKESLSKLQRVESDLKQLHRLSDSKNEELKRMQNEIEAWTAAGLKRMTELQSSLAADSFAAEARSELKTIDAELKKLGYDAALHESIRSAEMEGRESQERLTQLESANAALAPLEREIDSLEKAVDQAQLRLQILQQEYQVDRQKLEEALASTPDLVEAEQKFRALQEEVNQLLSQVGYARNQVDVLENLKVQKNAREEEKNTILQEIARYKMLEKAFGKDGVPALLIEQALPEIEMHANEILDRLSSGNMSLRFETQKRYRDAQREDRKETLDIMISASAEEREYELFSGGEAFRINFAVRLALSRVLANRAGARLQTLVIDEGFGSQDAEGRQRLIEAINFVKDEFSKIIVITHLEELKDAFSARIEVTKEPGGSQVSVVAA